MNEKEVGELRRRFRADKSNITHVHGCYVNEFKEIISRFDQSLTMMSQEESEEILGLLKRALSGGLAKNLLDVTFETQQVVDGAEHKLLMSLRDTGLRDDDVLDAFYQKAIGSVDLEGNYMILLAHDVYDVPYRSKDGEKQEDASSTAFSYLVCAVCPTKLTKPALSYTAHENKFYNAGSDWVVSPPELGFLFPAFDDRATNLYNALYYTKNAAESHQDFVDAVFKRPAPMPAAEQRQTFQSLLQDALEEECSLETVQAVNEQLREVIAEHRESKVPEPLVLSKNAVKGVLRSCGVGDSHVTAFETRYDDAFGADAALSPKNIVDVKQMELKLPDVTIRVNPERGDLVETRIIDNVKYILVRADEGVEVEGVNIQIK